MTGEVVRMNRQRLGIFVDVQNMFYSAKALHQSKIDYSKLLQEVVANRELIRAVAYAVHKPDVDQSGFSDALKRLGYEIKSKEYVSDRTGLPRAIGTWGLLLIPLQ